MTFSLEEFSLEPVLRNWNKDDSATIVRSRLRNLEIRHLSSRECDQYWNGVAWLPSGPNRIDDDLDEAERLEVLEQHQRIVSETKPLTSPEMSELDRANLEAERASFEDVNRPETAIQRVVYSTDWGIEDDSDIDDIDYDFAIDPDYWGLYDVSVDEDYGRYHLAYGRHPNSDDYSDDDECYEYPGLSSEVSQEDLFDELAERYAEARWSSSDPDL